MSVDLFIGGISFVLVLLEIHTLDYRAIWFFTFASLDCCLVCKPLGIITIGLTVVLLLLVCVSLHCRLVQRILNEGQI